MSINSCDKEMLFRKKNVICLNPGNFNDCAAICSLSYYSVYSDFVTMTFGFLTSVCGAQLENQYFDCA